MIPDIHTRTATLELVESDGLTIEGYAAVFGQPTEIVEHGRAFTETIHPGAFARTLAQRGPAKVKMQYDHGHDPAVGSLPIGAWEEIREDVHGLFVRGRLLDVPETARIRAAIQVGAIDGMSFRFRVPEGGATWSADERSVELHEVALLEAGPVAWAAYEGTSVGVRGLSAALVDVCRAILTGETGAAGPDAGTPDPKSEAVRPAVVTLAERRSRALALRGVTDNESSGAPAGATRRG